MKIAKYAIGTRDRFGLQGNTLSMPIISDLAMLTSILRAAISLLLRPWQMRRYRHEPYVKALRHDQSCSGYDVNLLQLFHLGYKVAAELGDVYLNALRQNEEVVARNVTENLFERHVLPLFL